jgi:hypothetical protein
MDGIPTRRAGLAPLFFVSLFSVSFETFLTRYFAVAVLSGYSYWIISIALFGYSVAGVVLSMLREKFLRRRENWLFAIPPAILAASALAFFVLRANPFNPLQLQNEALWKTQIPLIFLYYAGLFPVFFLSGLFVGLTFMSEIPRAYAFDLMGAAAGSTLILSSMFVVHPYHLPAVGLPALFIAIFLLSARRFKGRGTLRAGAFLLVCLAALGLEMACILGVDPLSIPAFKTLFPILHIEGSKAERSAVSPSGAYVVMNDYTEFDDVNMTNNYQSLGIGSPPRSFGLYKDGQRISSLVRDVPSDLSYVEGSLPFFPYTITDGPVLLIGTNGGYRLFEAAGRPATALEPQGTPFALISGALASLSGGSPAAAVASRSLSCGSVFSLLRGGKRFSLIDVSSDLLSQDENNRYAFTLDAFRLYLDSLSPGGILSIPVNISEFTVYALKAINTAVEALRGIGVGDPSKNLIVYRSTWSVRILASTTPFTAEKIETLRSWCSARSFDTSYFPGINPSTIDVWNDLPRMSFDQEVPSGSGDAQDSLMEDIVGSFEKSAVGRIASGYFDLSPSTLDRPEFFSISRLSRLGQLLSRVSLLPEQEIGYLINLVVLGQALLLALLIVFLPIGSLARTPIGISVSVPLFSRVILYFAAIGLAYLFVELAFMEKFSFFLGSGSASFGVVLASMLVFSGLGSLRSSRFASRPYPAVLRALAILGAVLLLAILALDRLMALAVSLPAALKAPIVVVVTAPASYAMGRYFPLGNSSLGEASRPLIPWAWAVNGAFSVIATPLANIVSTRYGWRFVLASALLLYLSTALSFPLRKGIAPRRLEQKAADP